MTTIYLFIFIISLYFLAYSSKKLVQSLTNVAKFLNWKEFVVAFFAMALATTIPNLSVGISSALHKIPQLSFGDVVGNNIVDLTLAVALAVIVSKRGLKIPGKTVQGSALFVLIIAIFPLLLIYDGLLSRVDGILLILSFIIYALWLFSRKDRFKKRYKPKHKANGLTKSLMYMAGSLVLLLVAAEGIVRSATYFSEYFNIPIVIIGILIVGLGNALPEVFFVIQAAKRGRTWMIVGNLMGSIIFLSTLALGIVALIHPIEIIDFSPFAIARAFLILSAIFFLIFIRTDSRISKKEGYFLLAVYILFVVAEIILK